MTRAAKAIVVPKGLRSFDAGDKSFFLDLLPGPRDADGLPESVRFWKYRIEATKEPTFAVGVLYGPSGCGKTSLMKAGVIPRLSERIVPVYVEAAATATETRLLEGLRRFLRLPDDLGLSDSLAELRKDRVKGLKGGKKALIVIDQFEQWLHANRTGRECELTQCLRQCDGDRVQAILMIRDDFCGLITSFLRDLRLEFDTSQNADFLDLFDPEHARSVLIEFGRAYGRLPVDPKQMSKDEAEFLNETVTGLGEDHRGRVASVRLALFSEMVKGKPWTPATLKDVGGTHGVGVTFLEETFSAASAPPDHRLHQKAARLVLKTLLPESGTDIKGQMRSHDELREASGYAARPTDFADLLRILDSELRLITPTDPEGSESKGETRPAVEGRYYQLTHDYLVPSLREWLTRKQRETRRGRAELRLAERSSLWNTRPENRHLPSALEWAKIRLLTRKRDWTVPQSKMMKKSGRVHGLRTLGLVVLIALGIWGGIEGYGNMRASALVDSLKTAGTPEIPPIIDQVSGYRRWADRRLKQVLEDSKPNNREHLHASLALLPVDASQVDYLYGRLFTASSLDIPILRDALQEHRTRLTPQLWAVMESARPDEPRLLPASGALALFDPESPRWAEVGGKVARALVSVNPVFLRPWLDALKPVRGKLTSPLATIVRDRQCSESERTQATSIVVDYASDNPGLLADLLMDAEPKLYATLFPVVERNRSKSIPVFQGEIQKKAKPAENETNPEGVNDRLAERQARAAVALVRMGKAEEVWPLLRHSTDPRLRSFIVNWLDSLGADPKAVVAGLDAIDPGLKPTPAEPPNLMDTILFHPETSQRRALILALGTYWVRAIGLSPGERGPLTIKLLDLYRNDPDAGVHGAVEWTLRQWEQQEKLKGVNTELMTLKDLGDRRWYVNGQGQTFALIEGPVEFRMGSPETKPYHFSDETLHTQQINRRFALATKEVTVDQYKKFYILYSENQYSIFPEGPMNGPTWYEAAAYCNWLSEREGLDKAQWCYEPTAEGQYAEGMQVVPDVLKRTGYRLPTEAEWEYGCRAGAVTSRYYGVSVELLGQYAWFNENSKGRARPCGLVKPNDLGLFDILGNVHEWCHDQYDPDSYKASIINDKIPRHLRGGAFTDEASFVRSAVRNSSTPSYRSIYCGFRPSRTYP